MQSKLTIIEVMIILAVIGILAAIIVPGMQDRSPKAQAAAVRECRSVGLSAKISDAGRVTCAVPKEMTIE